MPNIPGKGLVYIQPLYDTLVLAAGAVTGQFFSIPLGGVLTGVILKNIRHTSLVQQGRLETGNSLNIEAVSLNFPETAEAGALPTVADKRAIRAGSLRFIFGGDTEFLKLPAAYFPNAGGGEVTVDGTVALNQVTNGVPVSQNKFYLDQTLVLAAQESISVFIENMDTITDPTEIQIVLWGEAIRPVR